MSSLAHKRRAPLAVLALVGASIAAAGCGSSGSSSSSAQQTHSATETSASAAGGREGAGTTPTSGPLSREPKVSIPSGPPPSHLVTTEIIRGHGAEAKPGDHVVVNYVGAFYRSGKVFDASWRHGAPFPFTIGQHEVIPGWEAGVTGMRVGGRRELIIPPSLAYGPSGRPPVIPPNATLVFVVDLLSV
jgi:peptidylprolyl isomerase